MPAAKLHLNTEASLYPGYKPIPKLKHISCGKCPKPGDPLHPFTRVPYNQSLNNPGNMLVKTIQVSQKIQNATAHGGHPRIQYGNCYRLSDIRCPRQVNALGGSFGAPGGSRTPPRNSF